MEVKGGHDLYYETHALIPVLDWKLSACIAELISGHVQEYSVRSQAEKSSEYGFGGQQNE